MIYAKNYETVFKFVNVYKTVASFFRHGVDIAFIVLAN